MDIHACTHILPYLCIYNSCSLDNNQIKAYTVKLDFALSWQIFDSCSWTGRHAVENLEWRERQNRAHFELESVTEEL